MLGWFFAAALAASPWKDVETDVRVEAQVPLSPEAVTEALADLRRWETLFDVSCLKRWEHGERSAGQGATARVVYTPGLMNRRLDVVVKEVVEGRKVLLDHLGNRGFFTKITVAAGEAGTTVVVETPISAPPWPFRKLYHLDVKPMWVECYRAALGKLAEGAK
jgi:hypothetical protein